MRRRLLLIPIALALALVTVGSASSSGGRRVTNDDVADSPREVHQQHGGIGGHVPGSKENVKLVGKLRMHDAAPGRISDVGYLNGFAYLGAYVDPNCTDGGVYVVDVRNPKKPKEIGFIRTAEGTYVSEGVQALEIKTKRFKGDLLVHNNEICGDTGIGGMSLWDVTNPRKPKALALGVGDTNDGTQEQANEIHSVFAWQAGSKAYAVLVDDDEDTDVDIFDITNPRRPKMIAETGLVDWPAAQDPLANGSTTFFHDVMVNKVDKKWVMLISYWDAGWVKLDVTNPAKPKFIKDFDYTVPDTVSGFTPPEGNAHQAEWDRNFKFFIGTDEDFAPERLTRFAITSGPATGRFPGGVFGFGTPVTPLGEAGIHGPTVFGGYGCDDDVAAIPNPSVLGSLQPGEQKILVLQRGPLGDPNHTGHGPCLFFEKAQNGLDAGYDAVIIANRHRGTAGVTPDEPACGGGDQVKVFAICVGHRAFHLLFHRPADPATNPEAFNVPYPEGDPNDIEPNIGDLGERIHAVARPDAWGYAHLIDGKSMREIDTYAPQEVFDERFLTGFGDLSVHEVATDPEADLAYFSWYNLGFRVVTFGKKGFEEVGHYADKGGNNFWGVQVAKPCGKLILASDRDSGLWIFEYTGPKPKCHEDDD